MKKNNIVKKIIYGNKLNYIFDIFKRKQITNIPVIIKLISQLKMKKKCANNLCEKATPLFIKTPDGFAQCVHPDIFKVGDGSYYMVITPYPFGWDIFENPVLYQSRDLLNWNYISGPIDVPSFGENNHLSDATITKGDRYICYYRECIYSRKPYQTIIYSQESDDCINWENKRIVTQIHMKEIDIISPDIYYEDGLKVYFCMKKNDSMHLMYTEDESLDYKHCQEIEVVGIPRDKVLWHSSVVRSNNVVLLLLTIADDFGGKNSRLYIAKVDEKNKKATIVKKLNIIDMIPEIELEYRATGLIENDCLKIIASVRYSDKTWGCVFLEECGIKNM